MKVFVLLPQGGFLNGDTPCRLKESWSRLSWVELMELGQRKVDIGTRWGKARATKTGSTSEEHDSSLHGP